VLVVIEEVAMTLDSGHMEFLDEGGPNIFSRYWVSVQAGSVVMRISYAVEDNGGLKWYDLETGLPIFEIVQADGTVKFGIGIDGS